MTVQVAQFPLLQMGHKTPTGLCVQGSGLPVLQTEDCHQASLSASLSYMRSFLTDFGPLFAANAAAAVVRRVGTHGVLDLHCTKGLQATQYIGAVNLLDRGPKGLFAQGGGSGFVHSSDAVEVNAVEQGQAVGICLEVASPLVQPQAFIQASIKGQN